MTVSKLPNPKTLPDLLLNLIALSGEFPNGQLLRLPAADSYIERAVKQLKKDGLIRAYYRDGLRGLRLTAAAKQLLLHDYTSRFQSCLTGTSEINRPKSEYTRRLRLHLMAGAMVTMMRAGIRFYPWEKPQIFRPDPLGAQPHITDPIYYTSREVKEIGLQANKFRGSRATGVLLASDQIYTIYNAGAGEMKWESRAEVRLRAFWVAELCLKRLSDQYFEAPLSAIVIADSMTWLPWLMGKEGYGSRSYFVLEGNFDHFHFLTNDHHGEILLQLLCSQEKTAELNDILCEGMTERKADWIMDNDGFDGDGQPFLFGYTCDMPRIEKFDSGLSLYGLQGILFCFDFQEEALRRVCGQYIKLQVIDFDAYERGVFYQP